MDETGPTQTPANKGVEEHSNSLPSEDRYSWRRFIMESVTGGLVGTGLWVIGERFENHGHPILGSIFNYIAVLLFFAGIPLFFLKLGKKSKHVLAGYSLWAILLAVIFALSSHEEKVPAQSLIAKQDDLKQDIRTFLESLNPEVLRLVDAGKPEIAIMIGPKSQAKLWNMSERQGFNKYLSFKQTTAMIVGSEGSTVAGFLNEPGENTAIGFIFYPKDALKR